jgi:hypothetical protein
LYVNRPADILSLGGGGVKYISVSPEETACYLPLRDEVRTNAEDGGRPIGKVRAVEASLSAARVTVHRTTVTATIRRPSSVSPCGTHTQT